MIHRSILFNWIKVISIFEPLEFHSLYFEKKYAQLKYSTLDLIRNVRNSSLCLLFFLLLLDKSINKTNFSFYRYYPYHYAPFISDVANFTVQDLHYDIGKPFKPFEQLLAVLPAASRKLLPKSFQVPTQSISILLRLLLRIHRHLLIFVFP